MSKVVEFITVMLQSLFVFAAFLQYAISAFGGGDNSAFQFNVIAILSFAFFQIISLRYAKKDSE